MELSMKRLLLELAKLALFLVPILFLAGLWAGYVTNGDLFELWAFWVK